MDFFQILFSDGFAPANFVSRVRMTGMPRPLNCFAGCLLINSGRATANLQDGAFVSQH